VRRGRRLPPQDLREAPGRDQRPDTLQQEEAELLLVPGENGQDRRADQVERQVGARALVELAELRRRVGRQDQDCADDLDYLVDAIGL
jgi:hypothetical protein